MNYRQYSFIAMRISSDNVNPSLFAFVTALLCKTVERLTLCLYVFLLIVFPFVSGCGLCLSVLFDILTNKIVLRGATIHHKIILSK